MTAYIFQGYWEDIGTIAAFFEANLNLTDPNPKFSFNEPGAPVYTHPRFLPASIAFTSIDRSWFATVASSIRQRRAQIIGIRP